MATKKTPAKDTRSRSQVLDDMKKDSNKASAKAKSAADPTPKKFQGANRAAEKAADKAASAPASQSSPSNTSSPAKQLLDKLRGRPAEGTSPFDNGGKAGPPTGAPDEVAGPRSNPMWDQARSPYGTGKPGPIEDATAGPRSTGPMWEKAANPTIGENFARSGGGASRPGGGGSLGRLGGMAGLLGIGAALAAIRDHNPEDFDQTVKDMLNPMSTVRDMGELGDGGEGRMYRHNMSHQPSMKPTPEQPSPMEVPNAADIRSMAGGSIGDGGSAPAQTSPAKAVRAQAKSKASSVRETGGPLTDQEILDWNRKNNKNYRD